MSAGGMSRRFILPAAATLTCGLLLCVLDSGRCVAPEPPAVDDFVVQSWQTDEGLPGNTVNGVLQDQKGYIWLATIGGLVRFDGVTFKLFASPLIARLAARNIRALAETADSTLLMLPAVGGVVQLKDGQFSLHPAGEGLAGKQMQTLFVDRGGAIWIGMEDGQVRRWQDGKSFDFAPTNVLTIRNRVSFAADNEGRVWIASGGFACCYRDGKLAWLNNDLEADGYAVVASSHSGGIWIWKNARLLKWEGGQLSTVSTNLPWVALGGVVREMFEDSSGALWIGTGAHGLFRYADGKFIHVETSQSQITSIVEDGEGDIWVGTLGGGINRLRPKLFHLYNTKSGLPEDVSDGVCADDRGDVWLANRGGGVARISNGQVSVLGLQTGSHKFRAYSVCADDRGALWVNEDEGGLYRFPRDHPDQVQTVSNGLTGKITLVHVLFKSRAGDIWIGADPNLLGYFRGGLPENYVPETKFPGRRPRSITEDSRGRIWIGTEDRQLIELADGKFTLFTRQDGLPDAPIRSLYADDGSLWIGTAGGGLVLRRDEKFTLISVTNGLPDDIIAGMLEDDAGRLWCGALGGIFHVAKADLLAFADGKIPKVNGITFSKSEGLAGISFLNTAQPMACRTPDGQLWFATLEGVLSLDSARLKINSRPPPVFIDGLFVNDRPLEITDSLQVPPLCNKIEFRFSVLSYAGSKGVRVRYKLDGVDSDWVEMVNQRAAVYSALRPGKYQMHLKACNNDGVWNETGTSLSFAVRPAWWQSWWFQGSMLVVFMTLSATGISYWAWRRLKLKLERLEHQQALAKERTRIARDLHDDLGATVTQVGMMLEEQRAMPFSVAEIRQQSAEISGRVLNLARDLDAVVWSVNPGNDSLGELFAYLGQSFLECFRRTAIRPRLEVMETVPDSALAPEVRHHLFLVVKEAMNNVVKHSQATEVTLTLKVVANTLEIRIADNGRGFLPDAIAQSKRHGVPNMRARVEQLGGKFEVSSEPGKGTAIRVLIPSWRDLRVGPRRTE
jgi:signal transduction histidine kinase/ligand-binding sensor domain-containing protein